MGEAAESKEELVGLEVSVAAPLIDRSIWMSVQEDLERLPSHADGHDPVGELTSLAVQQGPRCRHGIDVI